MARRIISHNGIIVAIYKHVIAQHALAGCDEGVCIEEAAPFGAVISALQVIQAVFVVVDITAVAQGVEGAQRGSHGAGNGQDVAPGVVDVLHNCHVTGIYNGNDIPLQVGHVVINRAVPSDRPGRAKGIIGKVQRIGALGHLRQLTTIVGVELIVLLVTSGDRRSDPRCRLVTLFPIILNYSYNNNNKQNCRNARNPF